METIARRLPSKSAALLLLILSLLGCGRNLLPFQTTSLAGAGADPGRFEGRWFDEQGNLIAVVSNRAKPRLGVRLPSWLTLEDARFQGGRLLFHVSSDQLAKPVPGALELIGEDHLAMGEVVPPRLDPHDFYCGNAFVIPTGLLIREPSSLWLMKRSARRITRLASKSYQRAHDKTFDWVSRIL